MGHSTLAVLGHRGELGNSSGSKLSFSFKPRDWPLLPGRQASPVYITVISSEIQIPFTVIKDIVCVVWVITQFSIVYTNKKWQRE